MGGYSYSRPVYGSSTKSKSRATGSMSSSASKSKMTSTGLHKWMQPTKEVECDVPNPIFVGLDVTGSNRDLARVFYDKAPMFFGQLEQKEYLPKDSFKISFCAIGDATCDEAPCQIAEPEFGISIDKWLEKMWLEGGGGGGTSESYELFAYFMLNRVKMPKTEIPFLFIIADEGPYEEVAVDELEDFLKEDQPVEPLQTNKIFTKLIEKFNGNVFILLNKYSGSYWDDGIIKKWEDAIPVQHIIKLEDDEKSVVDVMLGLIAIATKSRDLKSYTKDLKDKGQDDDRIASVTKSLTPYVNSGAVAKKGSTKLF